MITTVSLSLACMHHAILFHNFDHKRSCIKYKPLGSRMGNTFQISYYSYRDLSIFLLFFVFYPYKEVKTFDIAGVARVSENCLKQKN